MRGRIALLLCSLLWALDCLVSHGWAASLRCGAAVADATPQKLPVLVNGGILSRTVGEVKTPLKVRAIVLDDGQERVGLAVVDTCMMSRGFLDEVKQLVAGRTGIRPDRLTISATHTHSAPAATGALGTDAEPSYVPYLKEKIVEALVAAESHLEPARVGWASVNAAPYTALRRWIRRPDRVAIDPFGNPTVRANMHAGRNWDDVTGESGPEDPELAVIAFQATDGAPLAVLANFSMHYFGGQRGLSADYFGLFAGGLEEALAGGDRRGHPPMVAIMSHGCSGDIWRRDYAVPPSQASPEPTIESYAAALVKLAAAAYRSIRFEDADLAMAERRLKMKYRVPNKQLLEWARRIVDAMGERPPKTTEEVYAREQILLHQRQSTEVVVQALRIGRIGIATTPTETYALSGLKIKLQSPLERTMVIELANGGDGYIPPPEQHVLGGYNTWPARSAGLEVEAEPRIVEAALELLEAVSGRPRRRFQQSLGTAASAILRAKPVAYWRLDEMAGPRAVDASGHNRDGFYEPGVVFFLEGPRSDRFCTGGETNRSAHFAGGRLRTRIPALGDRYAVSLWFYNGMPTDARPITGWMFSRGYDHGLGSPSDHLGVGGMSTHPGKLVFLHSDDHEGARLSAGRTTIDRWTWNHVLLVRDGDQVRVYLNGNPQPEIDVSCPMGKGRPADQLFFGGRSDGQDNWEGRLDEIAVFDRPVSLAEIGMAE